MKNIYFILLILFFIIFLSSCNPTEKNDAMNQITTITFSKGKDYSDVTRNIIKQFELENPNIRVNLLEVPTTANEQHNIYITALSGADSRVDVYWLDNTFIPEFASKNYIECLEPYLKNLPSYIPQALEACKYNGNFYAVPAAMDMGLLYYRKDLVQEPPRTWQQLYQKAMELQTSGNIKYGVAISIDGEDMVCNALEYILSSGNDISEGLNMYKKMLSLAPSSTSEIVSGKFLQAFKTGEAAFMRNWSGAWKALNDEVSKVKGKVGIVHLPLKRNGSTSALLGGSSMVINKNSKYKEASLIFIKFWSSENAQRIQAEKGGILPVIKTLYNDEKVLESNPHFNNMLDFYPNCSVRDISTDYPSKSLYRQELILNFLNNLITEENVEESLEKSWVR